VAKSTEIEVQIEKRTLKLTNLDKVLYPDAGFTKGQVIDYYTRIAPILLPHCLLYTSPSPRDLSTSRMPSSA